MEVKYTQVNNNHTLVIDITRFNFLSLMRESIKGSLGHCQDGWGAEACSFRTKMVK